MSEPAVLTAREGRVLTITLNRPANGNAIDMPLAEALTAAVAQVDESVGAVLIVGAGKHFCVGGDLGEFGAAAEPDVFISALAGQLHVAVNALAELDVPVVVGLHGGVGGAGLSLAGIGDVVVCGRSAKLRPAYLAIGLTPDGGMSWTLPRAIGRTRFMDLLMTGGMLTADEALACGVVSRVVDDAEVHETAAQLAGQLAAGPASSYARLKALVRDGENRSLREQLDAEATSIGISAGSPDGREGVAAFVERRPAVYQH
ncbi:enoyl-CoA hydratase/isomerase family protein [Tomitella biformata]|uniref:enoyl-CoA hydratase/isomerase family protein n=1 Tax=Tomitella biformata TaxID=630403 RepID=UPI000466F606|nr:enoyl-CoA hydratase-related protein [Tomitella biformata]